MPLSKQCNLDTKVKEKGYGLRVNLILLLKVKELRNNHHFLYLFSVIHDLIKMNQENIMSECNGSNLLNHPNMVGK